MCENDLLLRDRRVTEATHGRLSSEYQPGGRHGRVVQAAFKRLSEQSLSLSGASSKIVTVVVDGPGTWPINAIVMPNGDRKVYWAAHARHNHVELPLHEKLSPFVYRDHGKQAPMTKALTLELTGTLEHPILKNVYAGNEIPPLPWEVTITDRDSLALFLKSVRFWQKNSFVYDVGNLADKKDKLETAPPKWSTIGISNPFQPR